MYVAVVRQLSRRIIFRDERCRSMDTAYLVITLVLAALVAFSGLGKLRRDPRIVRAQREKRSVALSVLS